MDPNLEEDEVRPGGGGGTSGELGRDGSLDNAGDSARGELEEGFVAFLREKSPIGEWRWDDLSEVKVRRGRRRVSSTIRPRTAPVTA